MIKAIDMNNEQVNIIYWIYIRGNCEEYDLTKHVYRELYLMTNIRGIQIMKLKSTDE